MPDEIPVCEGCGTTTDVIYGPCPYAEDVEGDSTPVWLCDECEAARADDI